MTLTASHASISKRINKYPFPELQEKEWAFFYSGKSMENLGIDPSTSRMQSERSTV